MQNKLDWTTTRLECASVEWRGVVVVVVVVDERVWGSRNLEHRRVNVGSDAREN